MSYGQLHQQIERIGRQLNGIGLGRNDRVAIVLPNGPEMAVTFLSVAACATCAPLNPEYRAEEFEFYLTDLRAKAVIVQAGMGSPVLEMAQKLGIAIIELTPAVDTNAGMFSLKTNDIGTTTNAGWAEADDIALVLHTSGTTARPKIVPLKQANICISANNIKHTLHLVPSDRCVNVMPLFHIHGLIGALMSSVSSGASIVCTQGFRPGQFFDWIEEFKPTWYTAVPTMHQTILARARENSEIISRNPLRFIRSSSSALSPQTASELEEIFNAPVIEAYGMTEAAHQMASNPLPPEERKLGSVGSAAGPEISIMNEQGNLLCAGEIGEIVIRGPNVMSGYENNPSANSSAFTNGWFRTGDQGVLDDDGFLSITARIKEIINRGGEKISPREIDEVLLDHPAIAQAVTFGSPHSALGEEVAAAVVLLNGAATTEGEIQRFAAARLAGFKVPRRVLIVDEIPKGPTGKLQRIGLAEKLGLAATNGMNADSSARAIVAPRDALELQLVKIWEKVLNVNPIGVRDNFFDRGGYSLLAAELVERIARELGIDLPIALLLQAPNVEQQAKIVREEGWMQLWASLVPIKPGGSKKPFYCIHAVGGNILGYRALAHHLGPDQPVYGLQSIGLDGKTPPYTRIEDMAAHYIRELLEFQPNGPYYLGGQSFGGSVAYEVACQLRELGKEVGLLALFDTNPPNHAIRSEWTEKLRKAIIGYFRRAKYHLRHTLFGPDRLLHITKKFRTIKRRTKSRLWQIAYKGYQSFDRPLPPGLQKVDEANRQAIKNYLPRPCSVPIALFLAQKRSIDESINPLTLWKGLAVGEFQVFQVPGDHVSLVVEPHVQVLAQKLIGCLDPVTRIPEPPPINLQDPILQMSQV